MKIPHRIQITPKISYEIVWVDRFDDVEMLGECRQGTRQILIKKGDDKEEEFSTFIHEVIHALSFENDINISHKAVYGLETAIATLLKLNKWEVKASPSALKPAK